MGFLFNGALVGVAGGPDGAHLLEHVVMDGAQLCLTISASSFTSSVSFK